MSVKKDLECFDTPDIMCVLLSELPVVARENAQIGNDVQLWNTWINKLKMSQELHVQIFFNPANFIRSESITPCQFCDVF